MPHSMTRFKPFALALLLAQSLMFLPGCLTADEKDEEFFTSGSEEADQRAQQRVNKIQQLRGVSADDQTPPKLTLYQRLGGEEGIDLILKDFLPRVIQDPRVNWSREGITRGGIMGIGDEPIAWEPTPDNIAVLHKHMAQFLALATGGPTNYQGRNMKEVHKGMTITNPEFDAVVGDLKASLDAKGVAAQEQKELLAIIESTRPQIVEKR